MTKKVLLVIGLYLCSMTVLAVAKDMSWSGWVSDSKCGVKGANAEHAACAKKCIADGEKPVLVVGEKVYTITNPDTLVSHAGEKVTVEGDIKGSALTVKTVKM